MSKPSNPQTPLSETRSDASAEPDASAESPAPVAGDASAEEARAWALAALQRCNELESVLRKVIVWFENPMDAAANDDARVVGEAMALNRLLDRAAELLDGEPPAPREPISPRRELN